MSNAIRQLIHDHTEDIEILQRSVVEVADPYVYIGTIIYPGGFYSHKVFLSRQSYKEYELPDELFTDVKPHNIGPTGIFTLCPEYTLNAVNRQLRREYTGENIDGWYPINLTALEELCEKYSVEDNDSQN